MTWVTTVSGRKFSFVDIDPDSICLHDIAHGLSRICRFNGHTSRFYSVARHSLNIAQYAHAAGYDINVVKQALLHDAAEAYCGDMVSPLKELCPDFKAIEKAVQRTIYTKYGLPEETYTEVKELDLRIMLSEKHALFPEGGPRWDIEDHYEPLGMLEIAKSVPGELRKVDSWILRLQGIHINKQDEQWMWTKGEYLDTLREYFKDD